jgi:Tol biopolymer transport system component/DNA-binding winged helix-turn-helix (wHTH) protein
MIVQSEQSARRYTSVIFGPFTLNLQNADLYKRGVRLRLQGQPFRVLAMLVANAGSVVTREELHRHVWGDETTVDFDHGLDVAVNKIRQVLEDTASAPVYIETLARRGYRFIGEVAEAPTESRPETSEEGLSFVSGDDRFAEFPPLTQRSFSLRNRTILFRIFAVLTLVAIASILSGLAVWRQAPIRPALIREITDTGRVYPGLPLQESFGQFATDGSRIFFSQIDNGLTLLAQASVGDGETSVLPFPVPGAAPMLENISPDGTRLLMRNQLAPEAEGPLWIMPATGGRAQLLGDIKSHDASWTPDGRRILFANGDDLYTSGEDGTDVHHLAALPGRAFWMRWSPDGNKLSFTLLAPLNHSTALWVMDADGSHAHAMQRADTPARSECCGSWTADGRYFVFQATHDGTTDIRAVEQGHWWHRIVMPAAFSITAGPLSYRSPLAMPNGHDIAFLGLHTHTELMEYSSTSQSFVPNGLLHSAQYVRYSRDGKWVAWVAPRGSSLWRSRSDGSQKLQLSPIGLEVYMVEWGPDGRQLVLRAREPGKLWRIYTVDADGGNLHPLLQDDRNQADPSWLGTSGDILFGRPPDLMAERSQRKELYIFHASDGTVTPVAGSEGVFSPRSSPDGRYVAALTLGQRYLVVLDRETGAWRSAANQFSADPGWSHDGKWIYAHSFQDRTQPIYRVRADGGPIEPIASLGNLKSFEFADYRLVGLAPGDVPLIRTRISTADLYLTTLGH